jgi:hypothetical protein
MQVGVGGGLLGQRPDIPARDGLLGQHREVIQRSGAVDE